MTEKASGSTPPGVSGEQESARWVRSMFGRVAPRYDLLNHVLSLNVDKYWRWRTVRLVRPVLRRPDAQVLDLCCGTGDLMLALERDRKNAVWGSDFCHPMLTTARTKTAQQGMRSRVFEADALQLPLLPDSLDLITVAFGFRNLANYRRGLEEMLRVLRVGGVAAVLEFSTPPNAVFGALYRFYSRRMLPYIGGLISGAPDAYTYLPESVRKFPEPDELAAEMSRTGFREVRYLRFTGGIVALHLGIK
jgi:demethylmenaquinone methyltransferase / 2-methoxy-6-polyprenyl-1,4-benzoquinol methylase